jgi:flagellar biosynthesis regulator FlbT
MVVSAAVSLLVEHVHQAINTTTRLRVLFFTFQNPSQLVCKAVAAIEQQREKATWQL